MSVRAKFKVQSITEEKEGESVLKQITLAPVYSGSDENKQFFRWTPSGQIVLGVLNAEASKQFAVGAEYYVDFSLAPKAE